MIMKIGKKDPSLLKIFLSLEEFASDYLEAAKVPYTGVMGLRIDGEMLKIEYPYSEGHHRYFDVYLEDYVMFIEEMLERK